MKCVVIRQSPNFTLTSYGNGLAYKLERHLPDGTICDFLIQGEDATTFRDLIEALETYSPETSTDEILSILWSEWS